MIKLLALKPLLSMVIGTAAVTGATYGATVLLSKNAEAQEERTITPQTVEMEDVTYNSTVSPEEEIRAILPPANTEDRIETKESNEYIEEEQENTEKVNSSVDIEQIKEKANVVATETESKMKSVVPSKNKEIKPSNSNTKKEQIKKEEVKQQPVTPKNNTPKAETKKEEVKVVTKKEEKKPSNPPKQQPVTKEEPAKSDNNKYSDLPDDLQAWFEEKDKAEAEAWEDFEKNSEEICGTCKPSEGNLFD